MVPTLVERIKAPDGFSERNGLYVPEHYGLNRRDFLKGAGATGLLAIAGGGLEGCASLAQDASLYHNEELLASGRLKVPEGYNLAKIGNYYVITDPQGNSLVATKPTSYVERIVENFTDIGRGLGNFFRNIFDGAKYLYADENQKIREGRHIGIGNNFYRAFQNLASVFTLGFWVPEGEKKLEGAKEHLLHIPRKFYEAIIGNLVAGIPRSVGNMLNNLVSSGVYAIQLVPTIFTGYSHKANEAVDEVLNYLTTGIRTLSNSVPYIGAGWQRAAEISWDIPLPIVNYAARGRREGEDVEPTTFRKSLEILTSAGLTAAGIVMGKNAARGSKRKVPAATTPAPGACFTSDTKVAMSDGSFKEISKIKIGDKVKSFDFRKSKKVNSKVTALFTFDKDSFLRLNSLKVTEKHPFAVGIDKWEEAGNLKVGDQVLGNNKITIKNIKRVTKPVAVFNITVNGTHNYYVSDNKNMFLVHNKGAPPFVCFVRGSNIKVDKNKTKPIEKIKIGDKVFAYNIKTRKWSKVFVTELQGGKNKGFFLLNKKLRVSPYHSVYVNGKAKKPSEIKLLDTLTTADRKKTKVTSIEYIDKKVDMHNLVLGRNENLLYVVNGFLVWNGW